MQTGQVKASMAERGNLSETERRLIFPDRKAHTHTVVEFPRNFPSRRAHKFQKGSTSMQGEHIGAAVSRLLSNPFVCDPENG